jgi:hypothetical protein
MKVGGAVGSCITDLSCTNWEVANVGEGAIPHLPMLFSEESKRFPVTDRLLMWVQTIWLQ